MAFVFAMVNLDCSSWIVRSCSQVNQSCSESAVGGGSNGATLIYVINQAKSWTTHQTKEFATRAVIAISNSKARGPFFNTL